MSSTRFTLQLGDLDMQVLSFDAHEAIGQPYRIDLRLVAEQPDLNLGALLRQPAWLHLNGERGLHGQVWRVEQSQCGRRLSHYRIELRPALSWLEQRRNCRIFEQLSVPQILRRLLAEHGIQGEACLLLTGRDYPARPYCVQYNETDLHFLQRLCEEEGLHYHFRHSPSGHVLVFGDDQTAFPRLEAPQRYQPGSGQPEDTPAIHGFTVRMDSCSDTATLRDHDDNQPRLLLDSRVSAADVPSSTQELYDYPGHFQDRNHGKHLARCALEAARQAHKRAEGRSTQPLLASGHFAELLGHPRGDCHQLWLVTEIHHHGTQPQVLEEFASDQGTTGYHNRFVATPWDTPFRLPSRHARPRLFGTQTAVVTGPGGEDIHCDEQGRAQVRFHWEREARGDAHSRAWLRVASGWAGPGYGALAIPRVGMEVLVSFLDGDVDRPLITGCLYHGEHPQPGPLPEHSARSLFRTRSSPGGEGCHELRIDDRRGAELISLHAQRDWVQDVRNDLRLRVGHDQHRTVAGNRCAETRGEQHTRIGANRLAELQADDHLTIGVSQQVRLGQDWLVEAARELHLSSGQKIVLGAGSQLTLKAGGSFITLDDSGVTLVGAQVRLNAGGSAGSGSGIAVQKPLPSGEREVGPAAQAAIPFKGPLASSQIAMAKTARLLGASRCPVCESCREGSCDL